MIVIIYFSPILIGIVLLLIYALMNLAYGEAVSLIPTMLDYLPIIGGVLFAILLIVSIVNAIRKKNFWYGVVMLLSWSKCILYNCFALETTLSIVHDLDSLLYSLIVLPILLAILCIPALIDTYTTISAWELIMDDDRDLTPAITQMAISWAIVIVIAIIGAFL